MRFRIKLYREMKLWLVGVPVLALVAWGTYGASVVRASCIRGSWERAYWDFVGGVGTMVLVIGSIALVICTLALLCERLQKSGFAAWITSDD